MIEHVDVQAEAPPPDEALADARNDADPSQPSDGDRMANGAAPPDELADRRNAGAGTPDSIDAILADIAECSGEGKPEIRHKPIMRRLARCPLADPIDVERVLKALQSAIPKSTRPTIPAIRKAYRAARKELVAGGSDNERKVCEQVLDEHYAAGKHIKRFGGQYWVYESGVWQRRTPGEIQRTLHAVLQSIEADGPANALYGLYGDGDKHPPVSRQAEQLAKYFRCEAGMPDHGNPDPMGFMRMDIPPVINFRNCAVAIETACPNQILAHDPARLETWQIAVDYDRKADTSEWDRFARLVFHVPDDADGAARDEQRDCIRHLEEFAGYAMLPERPLHTFAVMRGGSGAGKSTFVKVLRMLMGRSAKAVEMHRYATGEDNHARAGLMGTLLAYQEETESGEALPDGFLKAVSETCLMTANPKYRDDVDFICRALPLVLANPWPGIRSVDDAIRRRALVWDLKPIPMRLRDEARRKRLLSPEGLQGAARRFVEGASRLLLRGAWQPPRSSVAAQAEWLRNADTVTQWAESALIRTGDHKARLRRTDTYESYLEFMKETHPKGKGFGRNNFYARLGYILGDPEGAIRFPDDSIKPGWYGVRFRKTADGEPDAKDAFAD